MVQKRRFLAVPIGRESPRGALIGRSSEDSRQTGHLERRVTGTSAGLLRHAIGLGRGRFRRLKSAENGRQEDWEQCASKTVMRTLVDVGEKYQLCVDGNRSRGELDIQTENQNCRERYCQNGVESNRAAQILYRQQAVETTPGAEKTAAARGCWLHHQEQLLPALPYPATRKQLPRRPRQLVNRRADLERRGDVRALLTAQTAQHSCSKGELNAYETRRSVRAAPVETRRSSSSKPVNGQIGEWPRRMA